MLTLIMLMFFEGMMCKQRLNSLEMLRNMLRPPIQVYVYRNSQWIITLSHQLVPGDIVSLTSGRKLNQYSEYEDNIVPCDLVLLKGSCVVDEAMLTGESVPQMKESLSDHDNLDERLDLNAEKSMDIWRRHVVFGGTAFLQHTETSTADEASNLAYNFSPPPDKGFVLHNPGGNNSSFRMCRACRSNWIRVEPRGSNAKDPFRYGESEVILY